MKTVETQIHRFRDVVAMSAGGETIYLTVAQARAFSKAMNKTIRDVERLTFQKSECGTFEGEAYEQPGDAAKALADAGARF